MEKVLRSLVWPIKYMFHECKMLLRYLFDVFRPKHMLMSFKNTIIYMDKQNIILVMLLTIFGFLMIFSSSIIPGYEIGGDYLLYVNTQARWIIISIIAFVFIISISYTRLRNFVFFMVVFIYISLIGLFFFGKTINNATSWYDLKFMMFQPSEFIKILIPLTIAHFYSNYYSEAIDLKLKKYIKSPTSFFRSTYFILLYLISVVFLIFLQPDLGSAIAVFGVGIIVVISSGIKPKTILIIGLFAVASIAGLLLINNLFDIGLIQGYQLDRIKTWLNPFLDWEGAGWQLINGYISIALGGIFGVGIGLGTQKLGWVPEVQTDFIATVISEELGLIGIIGLVLIYFLLIRRVLLYAKKAPNIYSSLILVGFSGLLFTQIFINLGGISGLIPLTGVTLPFLSYGGSALLSLFIFFGIVQSITAHINFLEQKEHDNETG